MYLLAIAILACVGLSTQQTDYCSPNLCPLGGPHIACNGLTTLSPSCGAGAREIRMTPNYQATILTMHNKLRADIAYGNVFYNQNEFFPQAARMPTLQWDPELASVAAANARRCVYGNDHCRSTVKYRYAGQSIARQGYRAARPANEVITRFIQGWVSEYGLADDHIIASFPSGMKGYAVRNFAHMLSDRTTRIGCALVEFKKDQAVNYHFVCNYSFSNVINQPVYVLGLAGSKCTLGRNQEFPVLCSANEKVPAIP